MAGLTTPQFCNPNHGIYGNKFIGHRERRILDGRSPAGLNMEEMLRKEANNSKKYELKKELRSFEIKDAMKHTRLYHSSIFNTIRFNAISFKNRMKRLDILEKGFYELKYSRENVDILIYQHCFAKNEVSDIIRINNQNKKIYGTDARLIKRVFQDYIK